MQDAIQKGHNVSDYFAGAAVCGISVESDGFIYANSDYRKGDKVGDVAGIESVTDE